MEQVYEKALEALRLENPVALAVVTESSGHTPQVVGARMLVYPDGRIEGTVGGGRVEYEVIQAARRAKAAHLMTLHLGPDLGMCCGGRMEVLISPVHAEDTWLVEVVEASRNSLEV